MAKSTGMPMSDWQEIYMILKELTISSFKWEGLPPTVNARFLELSLFETGQVVFFNDSVMGHLCLKAVSEGMLDVYNEPVKVRTVTPTGFNAVLQNHVNGVLIYNNHMRTTPQLRLQHYAKRIANMENTIDININAQKTPFAIKTSKQKELTLRNIYKQYDEFTPAIFVDENVDLKNIDVMQTLAPYVADKIEEQKRKLWNEALSFIGIENNSSEKNERLVASEVMVSNGLAIANRNARLRAREIAAEEINRLFGLNVSVTLNNMSFIEMQGGGQIEDNAGGDGVV